MNNYEDRELARELQALASQISVPPGNVPARSGRPLVRVLTVTGAVAVLAAAVAVGAAINNLRSETDNSGEATAPSSSPSPSAGIAFPDYTLIAGTSNGFLYKIEAGQVRGAPVDVCHGQAVLAMHVSSTARSILVICGGNTQGQAVVVDAVTLAHLAGPIPVLPRPDVGAWAPDERSIALLQEGVCDPQAPVCSVHVLLWDLASGSTRVIRPDEALTFNLQWTALGLSVSLTQSPQSGTLIWNGQTWTRYSTHALWIADASGRALLVEASTGNLFGRVWEANAGQEVALGTGAAEFPLGLDGDRAIVWRDTPFTNSGALVVYRGQQEERQVPAELCLSAQQIDRWLLCTSSGAGALAYSLDANAFARQPLTGLGRFNVLAALPRNSQAATPAIVSRQAAIDNVRGLTTEVRRVDRIEAKLVPAGRLPTPAPGNSYPPSGPGLFWLVAVSGDISCNCIVDVSFRSAIYTIDAQTGSIGRVTKTSEMWPASFDALIDDALGR